MVITSEKTSVILAEHLTIKFENKAVIYQNSGEFETIKELLLIFRLNNFSNYKIMFVFSQKNNWIISIIKNK